MRDVSEDMRSATSDLRRQDQAQASARGSRALEKLHQLEQQLESAQPDERRRALGELQLEARQMADAQRQIASELGTAAQGAPGRDAVRKLAGEQDRLAERARSLQDSLKRQSAAANARERETPARGGSDPAKTAAAAGEAAKELERQQLPDRMQRAGDA